jgi:hypothetical protein
MATPLTDVIFYEDAIRLLAKKLDIDVEKLRGPDEVILIDLKTGDLTFGDKRSAGDIHLRGRRGKTRIQIGTSGNLFDKPASTSRVLIEGLTAKAVIGGEGEDGDLLLLSRSDEITVGLNGDSGNITLGGNDVDGDVIVLDENGLERIQLDGGLGERISGDLGIYADGKDGVLILGGGEGDGEIQLEDNEGETNAIFKTNTTKLGTDDQTHEISLHGTLRILDSSGKEQVTIRPDGTVKIRKLLLDGQELESSIISRMEKRIDELERKVKNLKDNE